METISLEAILSLKDSGYTKGMRQALDAQVELASQSDNSSKSITKQMTAANVAGNIISKAFGAITSSVDKAISRIDALSNYPKVMQTLGYTAKDAQQSIDYLSDGIDGLPTTLDGIVSSAQMLTASLNDIDKGTKAAVALNDMFLAGGQGAEAASRALTQYNQILAKGKVDQQSWNTMVEVAPGQMNQLAQSLLGATSNQKDLYEALQAGKISVADLNSEIIRLDKEGSESFSAFSEQALAATGGIGTAITNLHSAVTKGVANIVTAIDKAAEAAGLPTISEGLTIAKGAINDFFKAAADVAGKITSFVAPAIKFLGDNMDKIVPIIGSVVAGFVSMKVATAVKEKIDKLRQSIAESTSGVKAYTVMLEKYGNASRAQEKAEAARKKATELQARATAAAEKAERARVTATKLEEKAAKAKESAEKVSAKATELSTKAARANEIAEKNEAAAKGLNTAAAKQMEIATEQEAAAQKMSNTQMTLGQWCLTALSGGFSSASMAAEAFNKVIESNPLGFTITLITTTITVLQTLSSAFGGLSQEEKAAKEEQEEFLNQCSDTTESIKKNREEIKLQAEASAEAAVETRSMVDEIYDLSKKAKGNSKVQAQLSSKIAELNERVEDLNLEYDKETGLLNQNKDAVEKKVAAYSKLKELEAVQNAYNDNLSTEIELRAQQARLEEDYKKAKEGTLATQKLESSIWTELGNKALLERLAVASGEEQVRKQLEETQEELANLAADRENYGTQMSELEEMQRVEAEKTADAEKKAAWDAAMERAKARTDSIKRLSEAIVKRKQLLDQAVADGTVTLDMMTEKNQQTVEQLQSVWQGYVDQATNMFSALSDEQTLSVDQMIANIEKNQAVIANWGTNMESLRNRFAELNLDTAILDQLQTLGPEGAGYVAALAEATTEQLTILSNDFSNGGEVAMTALGSSLDSGAKDNLEKVEHLVTDVEESLSKQIEESNWSELSADIISGLAEGLGFDDEAVKAAKELAKNTYGGSKEEFGIGSPSKVYRDYGQDINAGLKIGLEQYANQPVNTAKNIAQRIISDTRSALANMRSVGMFAIQGLVNGMQAMAGRVEAVADSIANRARSTIESALKIGSPSRVMKQIGIWTGEGLAIGIEKTEGLIQRAADRMSDIAASVHIGDISSSGRTYTVQTAFAGDGNLTLEMNSLRDEVKELRTAILQQPVQVTSEFKVDGRQMAKGTATYMRSELNRKERLTEQIGGIK